MDEVFWDWAIKNAAEVVGNPDEEQSFARSLSRLADTLGEEAHDNLKVGRDLLNDAELTQDESEEEPLSESVAAEGFETGRFMEANVVVAAEDANQLRVLAQIVEGSGARLLN